METVVFVDDGDNPGYRTISDFSDVEKHLGSGLKAYFTVGDERKVYFRVKSPEHRLTFERACHSADLVERIVNYDWQIAATVFVDPKHLNRFVKTPEYFIHDVPPVGYMESRFFQPIGRDDSSSKTASPRGH